LFITTLLPSVPAEKLGTVTAFFSTIWQINQKRRRNISALDSFKETPCVAILNKQNCLMFLLQNHRTGGKNRSCVGVLVPVGVGRRWEKCVGGLIWYKYCTHMHENRKMISVEPFRNRGCRAKENGLRGWIQVWYFW
jgi:hypothetical protein